MCVVVAPVAVVGLDGSLPAGKVGESGRIEGVGVEEASRVDRRELRADAFGVGLQGRHERLGPVEFRLRTLVDLVQEDDVRHLDPFDEEVRERPVVVGPPPFGDLVAAEGIEKAPRVEDGHERVHAVTGGRGGVGREQTGDRRGFGDARGLHHERVEVAVSGEGDDRRLQVVAELTADTAVRQFGDPAAEIRPLGDQVGVDVHLAHVIDEYRQVPVSGGEQVVEQRRLARAEAPREDGDRDSVRIGHGWSGASRGLNGRVAGRCGDSGGARFMPRHAGD